jgi:methylated-DNA-[protein]-cysteine S-methyltransferase
MSQIKQRSVKTQFGLLCVVEEAGEITCLDWGIAADDHSDVLHAAEIQMLAYVRGELETFDLPMNAKNTDFQRDVCAVMFAIPFGYTRTYGEIAKNLGVPAQAVGQVCGGNPIPIIIPCHRVMGAKGLTGFSGEGDVETKVALLRHEGAAGLLI